MGSRCEGIGVYSSEGSRTRVQGVKGRWYRMSQRRKAYGSQVMDISTGDPVCGRWRWNGFTVIVCWMVDR